MVFENVCLLFAALTPILLRRQYSSYINMSLLLKGQLIDIAHRSDVGLYLRNAPHLTY